jgi:hypothetical protein
MEEKYYKPKIEEFHIGFEYELEQEDDDFNKSWSKEVAEQNVGVVINALIKSGCIRVKFLDKEDIESLGFTFFGCRLMTDNVTCDYPRVFSIKEPRDETKFGHNPKILYMICEVGPNLFDIENMVTKTKANKIFIKNKSELKKVLTQLSVVYGK